MKKCWAEFTGDCEGEITKEHIISYCLLPQKIKVVGLHWCKKEKIIDSQNLVQQNLCRKHNALLSPYDAEMKKFITTLEDMRDKDNLIKKYGLGTFHWPIIKEINGEKIEKWFVKTLINLCESEKIIVDKEKVANILFRNASLEKPLGLSLLVSVGLEIGISDDFDLGFYPLIIEKKEGRELTGGIFVKKGMIFMIQIPSSNPFQIEQDSKIDLSEKMGKEYSELRINWHNKEINMGHVRIGRINKTIQKMKIVWN